jgi:CheY-like chemotaxis protein
MPQGGELTFETDVVTIDGAACRDLSLPEGPASFLRLRITDTGCGMTDEVKKHLFEPFFTTKKPGEGTGMGLAGVYGAVQNHHGTVRVDSEPGKGTTFSLCLPLAPDSAVTESPDSGEAPVRGAARILLVDDEEPIRRMASELLRDLGYSVATCADGQEAVAYYGENWRQVDLVILDLAMPGMGGRDTFVALRRINPQVRALLSSGYSLDGEAQSVLDEGVLAFVAKPYRQIDLSRKVSEALARKP